jgi:hypothetical protein
LRKPRLYQNCNAIEDEEEEEEEEFYWSHRSMITINIPAIRN